MIDDKYIEQVLEGTDIVEVVSEYVSLKKKGANYEACCPFHQEKTPSFLVSPAKNTWHCFGSCQTGGNAITFLKHEGLTFTDAVKKLASRYGVVIEENNTPPSDDDIRKRAKRESLLIINERVAAFFVENRTLSAADSANKYIIKRWGEEYPKEIGIGYAQDSWDSLYKFAQTSALSIELMLEIGLLKESEKGKIYDMYRDRVIIPIRDKFHRVIGFTARDFLDKDNTPKYLNSSTSELYSKESSIFGIDTAQRQAVKEDRFYCVEGGPDVLRLQSIGVNNTIASLGAEWTENQFRQIQKMVTNICFLPDADPPKFGEKLGAGTKAVMKNGTRAMQCGFNATVREIPLAEGNRKNDPDSFCTNKTKFASLEEEDFIIWYARYAFSDKKTTEDISAAIAELCKLVAIVGDEVKQDMYLSKFQSEYKNKALWTKAFNFAKKQIQAKKVLEKGKSLNRDLYQRYGFFEDHNCYFSITTGGGDYQWSNFIMEPMFHIKDTLLPKRLYKIRNNNKQEEIIELKQEDLVSLAKFKQRVEGLGNFIWLATEKELTKLKMFLYEQTETAVEVVQLGWNRKGFYAYGNGVFDTEWHPVDEYGIVRLTSGNNYYLPASSKIYRDETKLFQFERRFVHLNYGGISLRDYTQKMIDVSGDNAKVGTCFLLAALFRDIITGYTKSFPILNLFGPKGSGKSELGHSLMSFFIIENTPPNIMNSTIAALADLVAQCANAIVHIDEFKNSLDIDKREFLKGLWDGAGRSRMNMDRDKKREITSVDCGVILSGQEMATADIALFSRLIYLTFNKSEFSDAQKRTFDDLKNTRARGVSHLTLQILRHRAKMEQGFIANYNQCMADVMDKIKNERVEDRILRNWVIPLAAFRTLEGVLELPFTYNEMARIVADGILRQNAECKSNNELANFWNMVSYLQQDGEIFYESDYRIDYVNEFKSDIAKEKMRFLRPKPILKVRQNRIFMLYKKFGKMVGDSTLPESSLSFYLENSKEYMGKMGSVRFKDIQKGVEVAKPVDEGGKVVWKKATAVNVALCFDYEMIMQNYSINLEVDMGDIQDVIIEKSKIEPPVPIQGSLNI